MSPDRRACPLIALAMSVVAVTSAAPLRAQVPETSKARLQGVVVDEASYQPVPDATVRVVGVDLEVITGRWGDFAFPTAPLGAVTLQIEAPGRPTVIQDVDVRLDRIAYVQVVLPSLAAMLSEVVARVYAADMPQVATAGTAVDLLEMAVPRLGISTGMVGESDVRIQLRDGLTVFGDATPTILVDGVAVSAEAAYDVLRNIPATDVQDIEVLKGPAAASLYPQAANGVIHVKTKRGG